MLKYRVLFFECPLVSTSGSFLSRGERWGGVCILIFHPAGGGSNSPRRALMPSSRLLRPGLRKVIQAINASTWASAGTRVSKVYTDATGALMIKSAISRNGEA